MRVVTSAPTRIDFAGGTLDIWPLYLFHPGAQTINGARAPQELAFNATQVFWQLVLEGVVAPGVNSQIQDLPWFHVTDYGRSVITQAAGHPHDPIGYVKRLKSRVPNVDGTVLAYGVRA